MVMLGKVVSCERKGEGLLALRRSLDSLAAMLGTRFGDPHGGVSVFHVRFRRSHSEGFHVLLQDGALREGKLTGKLHQWKRVKTRRGPLPHRAHIRNSLRK